MDSTPKRPGRPPKAGAALTAAERQRAYRERLVTAQDNAMLKPKEATTMALLASLKHHCNSIDTQPDHADIARRLAAPVIRELCDRYKIQLT
jgi:predicted P-loop ATPase/GTPase